MREIIKRIVCIGLCCLVAVFATGCGNIDLTSEIGGEESSAIQTYQPVLKVDNDVSAETSETTATTTTESATVEQDGNLYFKGDGFFADESFIGAESGISYNLTDKTIIYSKNADEKIYPASTTKLLTALVAIENYQDGFIFTAGSELDLVAEDASVAGLDYGDRMSLNTILVAMLIPSGNDAAYTIAVNIARLVSENELTDSEAVAYFSQMMNDYAKKIGCDGSNFCVPDGYHNDNHYTTANDMLKITLKAIECKGITDIVSTKAHTVYFEDGTIAKWSSGNILLDDNDLRYRVLGLKSGFTDEADFCFCGYAEMNGEKVVTVAFHSDSEDLRYEDTLKLMDVGFGIFDPNLPPHNVD